jgi:D-lactate dehydrogenase (cytochrome)
MLRSSYASVTEIAKAIDELRKTFPEDGRVSTDPHILTTYGSSDNSYHDSRPHSVVVQVHSTEDVVEVVNVARKWRIPLVPYSGATSLEGHFAGVSFSFTFRSREITRNKEHYRRYMH